MSEASLLAMCDSTIPGEDGGYLADETLTWLDHDLGAAGDDVPALVCFHHPPVTLTIPYVDGIRLAGEHRLADVLARHDNVVAVLCGHAHTASRVDVRRPAVAGRAGCRLDVDSAVGAPRHDRLHPACQPSPFTCSTTSAGSRRTIRVLP